MEARNGAQKSPRQRLVDVYDTDPPVRIVVDYLATHYARNRSHTMVDTLQEAGVGVPRADLIRVFKTLEDVGCGRFLVGRRGRPSRFQWNGNMLDIVREVSTAAPDVSDGRAPAGTGRTLMFSHAILLRANLPVYLMLPADLSAAEADVVADFVRALASTGSSGVPRISPTGMRTTESVQATEKDSGRDD